MSGPTDSGSYDLCYDSIELQPAPAIEGMILLGYYACHNWGAAIALSHL